MTAITPVDLSSFERVRHRARLFTLLLQIVLAFGGAFVAAQMTGFSQVEWALLLLDGLLCALLVPVLLHAHAHQKKSWSEAIGTFAIASGALVVLQRVAFAYHEPMLEDPLTNAFRPICAFVPFVQVAAVAVLRTRHAVHLCAIYSVLLCVIIVSGLIATGSFDLDRPGVTLVLLWLFAGNPLFLSMLYTLPRNQELLLITEKELRRAAEQAELLRQLHEGENRFSAFMDHSPAITWVKDEAGRYLFANIALERHYGMAAGSWKGKTDFDFLPESFAHDCRAAEIAVMQSGTARSSSGPGPDFAGKPREWLLVRFPISNEGGPPHVGGIATDITEGCRLEQALEDTKAHLKGLMDESPVLVWMKDSAGRYSYVSRSYERRFQLQSAQVLGKTDFDWWPQDVAEDFAKADREVLLSGKTVETVESTPDPDGMVRFWWVFKFPFQNSIGETFVGGVGVDITERKRAEDQVKLQSMTDELTGLYNRRGFFLLGEQEFKSLRRTAVPATMLFVDIDRLKYINDTYGHAAGDEAIVAVAEAHRLTFRDCDIIGRLGGDEFAILAVNCLDVAELQKRLTQQVDSFNQHHVRPWKLSVTIGAFHIAQSDAEDLESFIIKADEKMYEAKKARKTA